MANDNEILTIKEAATYLQLHPRSVYKLIHAGDIPHMKLLNKFRFVKEDLKKWVQGE